MGGMMATRLAVDEPLVEKAFSLGGVNGTGLFTSRTHRFFARRLGITDAAQRDFANTVFPTAAKTCDPKISNKLYFVHHVNDAIVPYSKFKANVSDFCVSPVHTFTYTSRIRYPSVTAHIIAAHGSPTLSFILAHLKR